MVNTNVKSNERILFIDVLKIISLITMPIIHWINIVVNYGFCSDEKIIDKLLYNESILYLFTPTIFLFCMGCGFLLTRHDNAIDFIRRGIKLLLIGLLLNLFRWDLMYGFAVSLLGEEYYSSATFSNWLSDILFFDGLFFLLVGILKYFKLSNKRIIIIFIIITIVFGIIRFKPIGITMADVLLTNFIYINEKSYFPITSWLIYPVLGYIFMNKYMQTKNKDLYLIKIGVVSLSLFIFFLIIFSITGKFEERFLFWGAGEFNMDIPTMLFTSSVGGVYIVFIYFISKLIINDKIISLISGISCNLNKIYFIHWVIIAWTGFFCKLKYNFDCKHVYSTYIVGFVIFIVSSIIANFISKIINKENVNLKK